MHNTNKIFLGTTLLSMIACKPPPEAPADLEDLCEYIFAHLGDEDVEELQAGLSNLDTWLHTEDNLSKTIEGYQINNLKDESVASLDDQDRAIRESLVGAAVGHTYNHTMHDIIDAMYVEDWSKVSNGTYSCYERIHDEQEPDCLLDGSCDWLTYQTTSVSSWAGLVTVESTNSGQIRTVETEHGTAFVQRTWLNDPAKTSGALGDLVNVYAQYYVNVVAPAADGSINRTVATWIDGEYFIEDQDFAKNQMIRTMQSQNEIITEWIDGLQDNEGSCICSEYDYENNECLPIE